MNAFVLAGGLSTRMGRDKALLEWQGRPLVEHAVEKLRAIGLRPRILGSRPDLARFAPVVPDNFPRQGPLGGIEAALTVSDTPLNLFLPVDLPLLPPEFIHWMLFRAELSEAAATIPRLGSRPQPLCAVYHRDLLAGIRVSLVRGDARVTWAIERVAREGGMRIDSFDVEAVAAAEAFSGISPDRISPHRWFENLNTPEDLVRGGREA